MFASYLAAISSDVTVVLATRSRYLVTLLVHQQFTLYALESLLS
jgi:hypothetical protein